MAAKRAPAKPKGPPASRDGHSIEARLNALELLGVAHERSLHALEDRCCWVVLLKTTAVQQAVDNLRAAWRDEDRTRRKAWEDAKKTDSSAQLGNHTMGSQRALLFAHLMSLFKAKVPVDAGPPRAAAEALAGLESIAVDTAVFRLKPRHETFKEGRVWVWQIMLAEQVHPDVRVALQNLTAFRHDDIGLAAQHSTDGPIVKSFGKGKGGKGRGKGAAPAPEAEETAMDEDDAAEPGKPKRQR